MFSGFLGENAIGYLFVFIEGCGEKCGFIILIFGLQQLFAIVGEAGQHSIHKHLVIRDHKTAFTWDCLESVKFSDEWRVFSTFMGVRPFDPGQPQRILGNEVFMLTVISGAL